MSRALLAALAGLAAVAILTAASFSAARPSPPGPGLRWMLARSSLEHLEAADPRAARQALDSTRTLVQGAAPLASDPNPSGWGARSVARFTSYGALAAEAAAGAVPGYVEAVHYDNEAWSQTPLAEQRHPAAFERRFCALAHDNGWSCAISPGQDLCGVLPHPRGDNYAHCYLDLDLAGKAARVADVVDVQAQALEPRGSRAYGNFVRRAGAQALAANPEVTVLANLSPTPDGRVITAKRILRCAKAALPYVSGFYVTVGAADGEKMMAVVARLEGLVERRLDD